MLVVAGCGGTDDPSMRRDDAGRPARDGGQIVTKPLKLAGKHLHLNARSDYGEIAIEVLDSAGQRVSTSRPICRDSLDTVAEWDGDPPEKTTGPVVLRITLKNACLYALWSM